MALTLKEIERTMRGLGYRLPRKGSDRMIKPFGANMFIFFLETNHLSNYFYTYQGEFKCWEDKDLSEDVKGNDFSRKVSLIEGTMFHQFFLDFPPLGFLTPEEKVEYMLDFDSEKPSVET